ncbi:MAG: ABC transporter permease [Bacteroidetes bacterium]|nr:ABC transporter permease [Bacteroidota bacterium]
MIITLAWRNIWRNRRRSLLTIFAITFASFAILFQRGLATGTWELSVQHSVEMLSGYLQIQHLGYQENPSLAKNLVYPASFPELLRQTDGVVAFAPRIAADGLISYKDKSIGTMILGVHPDAERGVSRFHRQIKSGRFFTNGSIDEIVVGSTLLNNLHSKLGDTLVILAQGFDGVLGNLLFRVVGTVSMGAQEFDAGVVLMDMSAAQELLAMQNRISIIATAIDDLKRLEEIKQNLQSNIQQAGFEHTAVLTWAEVMPDLYQAMQFDHIGDYFFMGILILVVAFGILNTVLMSVTERFREFGVSLAVGMSPYRLMMIVMIESLVMVCLGILVGSGLGYAVNWYVKLNPIMLTGDFEKIYAQYGFLPQMTASTDAWIAVEVISIILIVAVCSIIYPLFRVVKLEPLKGIRHT